MAVFEMWTLRTRFIWKICLHLIACRNIFATDRLAAGRAPQNLFAILADLKICIDVWHRRAFQTCVDQFHILFCCGIPVHLPGIRSIHHNNSRRFLRWKLVKVIAKKTGIGIDILLILVVHNDGTVRSNSLHNICSISNMLLPGFSAVSRLRICWVLKGCRSGGILYLCAWTVATRLASSSCPCLVFGE